MVSNARNPFSTLRVLRRFGRSNLLDVVRCSSSPGRGPASGKAMPSLAWAILSFEFGRGSATIAL